MPSFDYRRRTKSIVQCTTYVEPQNSIEKDILMYGAVKEPYVFTRVIKDEAQSDDSEDTDVVNQTIRQRNTWPTTSKGPKPVRPGKPRYYSFDQVPTLTRTPWEAERHKHHSQSQWTRQRQPRQLPAHIFEQLPHEIYSCIVGHLEASYTRGAAVDVSGRQQALRTVCLTSKRWAKAAIEHLYRDLWLPSSLVSQKNSRRLSLSSRRLSISINRAKSPLDLLVRTIHDAPSLSFLVRRIHVSSALASELETEILQPVQRRFATRLLQDVVSRCSEVEHITGFTLPATNENTEWCGTLFSCERLTSHAWMMDLSQPPTFSPSQFVDFHDRWQWLETLVLCKNDRFDTRIGPGMISAVTNRLFSLKHLMVSGFSKDDFHNGTLLALKALKSLRLENLDGITDQGLFQLSHTRNAFSLESLSLINLELGSLQTIQNLLSNLTRLHRLRLVQGISPNPLVGGNPSNKRNTLSSPTLRYLHWDTLIPGEAIDALAHSLETTHLPALRTLKIPSDPDGTLQALCRPLRRASLTASDLRFLQSFDQDRFARSLRLSRLQAQLRIRESRARPSISVVVSDEHARVERTHVIGSFVGDVASRVEYSLEPDVEGAEEALVTVEDVTRPRARVTGGVGERVCEFGALF